MDVPEGTAAGIPDVGGERLPQDQDVAHPIRHVDQVGLGVVGAVFRGLDEFNIRSFRDEGIPCRRDIPQENFEFIFVIRRDPFTELANPHRDPEQLGIAHQPLATKDHSRPPKGKDTRKPVSKHIAAAGLVTTDQKLLVRNVSPSQVSRVGDVVQLQFDRIGVEPPKLRVRPVRRFGNDRAIIHRPKHFLNTHTLAYGVAKVVNGVLKTIFIALGIGAHAVDDMSQEVRFVLCLRGWVFALLGEWMDDVFRPGCRLLNLMQVLGQARPGVLHDDIEVV